MPTPWWHPEQMAKRRPALEARRAAVKAVRAYFQAEGFLEVETPALQVSPGIERHIHAFKTTLVAQEGLEPPKVRYLHTSPEFAMKKLLAGGLEKIVQLCPVYRDGEWTALHHPAFTMLEWYRAQADYTAIMDDSLRVLQQVAKAAHRSLETDGQLRWKGRVCDPTAAAERLTVQEAFGRIGIDLLATITDHAASMPEPDKLRTAARAIGVTSTETDSWEDIFFRVMLEKIEPYLGAGRPTVLYDYPACLGALARKKPTDSRVAERFELYACGVELGNAFSELTDAAEQRARFAHDRAMFERLYGEAPPLDDDFLACLDFLPPCAGGALGFDRIVMLAIGAERIEDVLWAPVST